MWKLKVFGKIRVSEILRKSRVVSNRCQLAIDRVNVVDNDTFVLVTQPGNETSENTGK